MLEINYNREYGYYIKRDMGGNSDNGIAKFLKIKVKEYIDILKKFNAHYHKEYEEYFFEYKNDAQHCCDYLNEVYMVMKKLTGEEELY